MSWKCHIVSLTAMKMINYYGFKKTPTLELSYKGIYRYILKISLSYVFLSRFLMGCEVGPFPPP